MNTSIKAIVFDFGGVLEINQAGNINESVSEALGVPPSDFRKVYFEHNHLHNVGGLTFKETILQVAAVFDTKKEHVETVTNLLEQWESAKEINWELIALLPAYTQLGLKLGVLSNWSSELRSYLKEKEIIQLFDEITVSSEIGFQKPDRGAFDDIFKKLGVQPEEAVFIDDSRKSLETAGDIGYTPILFKNNAQLIIELEQLGIVVPEQTA